MGRPRRCRLQVGECRRGAARLQDELCLLVFLHQPVECRLVARPLPEGWYLQESHPPRAEFLLGFRRLPVGLCLLGSRHLRVVSRQWRRMPWVCPCRHPEQGLWARQPSHPIVSQPSEALQGGQR